MEAQIIQSQKMESIGRLAGGVAHDFNNLLTAIMGSVEVARALLPPDARARGARGDRAGGRRRRAAHPAAPDLRAAAGGGAAGDRRGGGGGRLEPLLRRVVGDRAQLALHALPGTWPISIDEGQLEQILVNLAANARDAMPDGGTLNIEIANVALTEARTFQGLEAAPAEYLEIMVSDTGVGMKEAVLERIFEPFFTTKGPGQGTGLGLPVVYGIARQNRGFIEPATPAFSVRCSTN